MSVKKFYSKYEKRGYLFDKTAQKFFSWQIDYRLNGKRKRERGFDSRKSAETALAAIKLRQKENKHDVPQTSAPVFFSDVIAARLDGIESTDEKARSRRVLNCLLNLTQNEHILITDVTLEHLKAFVKFRLATVAKSTVDRELTAIAACFNFAVLNYLQLERWKVPKMPRPKKADVRREKVISDVEREKLISHLARKKSDDESTANYNSRILAGLILELALLTAIRHGDICALTVRNYDAKRARLDFIAKKTGRNVSIYPLPKRAVEILNSRKELNQNFLFSKRGRIEQRIYVALDLACSQIGIIYGRDKTGGVIIHDARHTFTSKLNESGVDFATIAAFTGHSDKTMILRYSHTNDLQRKKAMDILSNEASGSLGEDDLSNLYDKIISGELLKADFLKIFRDK